MSRSGRLFSARQWVKAFEGKNLVRGYAKWFGVDRLCAAKELGMMGVVDPTYVARLECRRHERVRMRAEARARAAARAEAHQRELLDEQDEHFAFIAGRTSAGFAYGLTWEEYEALGLR